MSTCFALQAIYLSADRSVYDSMIEFDIGPASSMSNKQKIILQNVFESVLLADWREDDSFQVSLLLYTLLRVDEIRIILSEETLINDQRTAFDVSSIIIKKAIAHFIVNSFYFFFFNSFNAHKIGGF